MTMAVTDEQVAALRAYLYLRSDQEADKAEQLFKQLARSGAVEGIGELLYAAFTVAARRKFSPTWTLADIVRFVAQVRAQASDEPSLLDPAAAEHQLRTALGAKLPGYPAEEARAQTQLVLLPALADSLGLDQAGLDGLLAEARPLADQLITQQHRSSRA